MSLSIVRFRAAIKNQRNWFTYFFVIGIGLANGANQFIIAIIATLITIFILYIRKVYYDKKIGNNLSESSTNILQIQIIGQNQDSKKVIEKLKKV